MTKTTRTILVTLLVTAGVLGSLVATGYALRARLVETTLVVTLLDGLGWRPDAPPAEPGAVGGTVMGDMPGMAAPNPEADPAAADAESAPLSRVEINIDPRRQQLIGVRTTPVERRALTQAIRAVGTVRYDETRLADVNVKVDGWIEELFVDYTGQFVEVGQPLFTLYSQELLTTQQEYLLALESRDRLQDSQVADARLYADRLVDAAAQRLALWDLPPEAVRGLDEGREPSRTMPFRSPVSGFVIAKQATQGQHVSAGESLYTVADLSEVWVEADLYEEELTLVNEGARATVTVAAYPGEPVQGRVIYIYPFVEEQTRTIRVRVALQNPRGRLKPGMYADVAFDVSLGEAVVVPTNALLDSGTEQHVFVSHGDGYFEPRPVVVGRRLGDTIQILEGLEGGEVVATSATFFLDSESQLRAALQGYEPVPRAADGAARERLDISFRSDPDPPRRGENALEVAVLDPSGQPLTDATVSVLFYMAAMPTMNMPAMQSNATLAHQGGGVYRGEGDVLTAGRWDVTVQVDRNGQRLDGRVFTVVAR
jgi:RND family efflux transporter MFP subunit